MDGYEEANMKIYNRWGQLLYEKDGYGNTTTWGDTEAWWDGRSNQDHVFNEGEILPSSTYFYILDLNNDGSDVRKGYMFLYNDK
jgi:uncharacterized membrane protein